MANTFKDAGGNSNSNPITIETESTETIDGANSATINTDFAELKIYSDGSDWFTF